MELNVDLDLDHFDPRITTTSGAFGVPFRGAILLLLLGAFLASAFAFDPQSEYRLLATNKTSTMQKEMAEAAESGFRFSAVMGGDTSFGGSEVVLVMERNRADYAPGRFQYRLLAANKTSTMQRELQAAGDNGFQHRGQTVFETAFGGREVVVILEKDCDADQPARYEYRLLATKKTSTMQKELSEASADGFELVGLTVSETAFAGTELVSILSRRQ